jgi:prepilin-type processing-associated H-X9-DG protein
MHARAGSRFHPAQKQLPHAEPLERRQLLSAAVTSLTLINADTDQPVPGFNLAQGATIDLAVTGRRLNVRADVTGSPLGSVRFNLDGNPAFHVENGAPYALAGDSSGNYAAWTPSFGTHTLVVTPYDNANGSGARGTSRAVTFTVIDSSTPPAPVRINAGGSSFTTGDGRLFGADAYFTGGSKISGTFSVAGTSDDTLYRTRRDGSSFSFNKSVPSGTYLLTLHFAEPTKTARGQRKFDVSAEGKLVLDDFDVYAAAGPKTAVRRTFTVPVNDGQMNVAFKGVVSTAIVSAVEIVPAPRTPAAPAPVWVNAGGGRYTDSVGRTFEADANFTGGSKATSAAYDVLMAPTTSAQLPYAYDDDALLLDYRAGTSFTYARTVANGNYAVWLEFAEPTAGPIAGPRVCDVSAEGALVLNDYDIVAHAGAAHLAVARSFNVSVKDGTLNLSFAGVVGQALVSAIAIVPTDIPAVALPYAGVQGSADPAKNAALDAARRVQSDARLLAISNSIQIYANENKGKFPPDLTTLVLRGSLEHQTFASPRGPTALAMPRGELSRLEQAAWVESLRDYVYVGAGLNFAFPADTWVAYENPDRVPGDTLGVLFLDGHIGDVARGEVLARYGGSATGPAIARPLDPVSDAKIGASAQNLRALAQAMQAWALDFRGYYPPDLGSLYYEVTIDRFISPRGGTQPPPPEWSDEQKIAWVNASTDFIYLAANLRQSRANSQTVIAYENPADLSGGINVLFGDGRVEFREMRWALEAIARPRP